MAGRLTRACWPKAQHLLAQPATGPGPGAGSAVRRFADDQQAQSNPSTAQVETPGLAFCHAETPADGSNLCIPY